MLVEMIAGEADHGDVDTFRPLAAKRPRDGPRREGDRRRLTLCEISEVIHMPLRDNQAVAEIGAWVSLGRWEMERDRLIVLPKQPAREVDLSCDLLAHQTRAVHVPILRRTSRGSNAGPAGG